MPRPGRPLAFLTVALAFGLLAWRHPHKGTRLGMYYSIVIDVYRPDGDYFRTQEGEFFFA